MRFERTALYAQENGYPIITSSLGISRWKNMEQINESGVRAAFIMKTLIIGLIIGEKGWPKMHV